MLPGRAVRLPANAAFMWPLALECLALRALVVLDALSSPHGSNVDLVLRDLLVSTRTFGTAFPFFLVLIFGAG